MALARTVRSFVPVAILAVTILVAEPTAPTVSTALPAHAPIAYEASSPPKWTHVATSLSPPMAGNLPMAYDPALNETVLLVSTPFSCQSYTWIFNGSWWNISSALSISPPPRIDSGMTYDAMDGYLLLWGGWDPCVGGDIKDTWSFSSSGWTRISPKVAPAPNAGFGMTYDARDGYVLMYCATVTKSTQTWAYAAGNWTLLHPKSLPPQGFGPALASVGGTKGYVLLFGGGTGRAIHNKTWEFYAGQWHLEHPSMPPSARSWAGLAYDTSIQKFVLFGGNFNLNDTWTFANKTWLDITSTSGVAPPPNYWSQAFGDFSMTYDSRTGQIVLFDGLNQTWTFS